VNYAFIICNGIDWKNNEIAKNVKNGVKSNAFLLAMQVIWGATTLGAVVACRMQLCRLP
jgi:hypothetical protein